MGKINQQANKCKINNKEIMSETTYTVKSNSHKKSKYFDKNKQQ